MSKQSPLHPVVENKKPSYPARSFISAIGLASALSVGCTQEQSHIVTPDEPASEPHYQADEDSTLGADLPDNVPLYRISGAQGSPGLTRQHVNERIIGSDQLMACADRWAEVGESDGGRIVVRFLVTQGGLTAQASIMSSNLADPVLEQCVLDAASALRFDVGRMDGEVTVVYPLNFRRR